jgi:arylsulfatase A-like enzyme
MNRRSFIKSAAAVGSSAFVGGCFNKWAAKEKRPVNFLFILVDDLGWRDLGCYGSSFYETPNIDRLAAQGMKFTNAYAASPVCSPTRASIQSGKYPARMGINFILDDGLVSPIYKLRAPHCETEMKLSEVTFAEVLKKQGYKTFFAGKWHLGHEEKYYPQNQGYDVNIGGHKGGQPASYFYPYKSESMGGYFNVPGLEDGYDGKYLTDHLADKAIEFIEQNSDSSFLAFMSFYSVHTPLQGKPELVEKYRKKAAAMGISGDEAAAIEPFACDDYRTEKIENTAAVKLVQNHAVYAAMVESVDQNVGRLLESLKRSGIEDNTVVVFFSDNGGFSTHTHRPVKDLPTSNYPLRAGKGWLYEGGIREPLIVKWPGFVKQGSVCDVPVTSVDFYPTIIEAAEVESTPQELDGVSLLPLLKGSKKLDREAIYWHMPHYHSSGVSPSGAVRCGDYKLIEYFEDGRIELFDLSSDQGEQHNIAETEPETAAKLKKMLVKWRQEINAAMPTVNR